jgi:hypothetical protein
MYVEYDIVVIYPRDISHCCFNCQRLCGGSETMINVKGQHENIILLWYLGKFSLMVTMLTIIL